MNDTASLSAGLAEGLRAIVGERGLFTAPDVLAPHLVDWRGH